MKIATPIALVCALSLLVACGRRTEALAPAAPADTALASDAAPTDGAKPPVDPQAQWRRDRQTIAAMSQQLAADPALMAKQSQICGSAPAQLQPHALAVPCRARDEALDIMVKRAQEASGGVRNTGNL